MLLPSGLPFECRSTAWRTPRADFPAQNTDPLPPSHCLGTELSSASAPHPSSGRPPPPPKNIGPPHFSARPPPDSPPPAERAGSPAIASRNTPSRESAARGQSPPPKIPWTRESRNQAPFEMPVNSSFGHLSNSSCETLHGSSSPSASAEGAASGGLFGSTGPSPAFLSSAFSAGIFCCRLFFQPARSFSSASSSSL